MKIHRFHGADMRRAIAMVRAEHGPEAVILSSRTTADGVEIVSATDYDPALAAALGGGLAGERRRSGLQTAAAHEGVKAADRGPGPTPFGSGELRSTETAPTAGPASGTEPLQAELDLLRKLLREHLAHADRADLDAARPDRSLLRRRLEGLGVERALADAVAGETLADGGAAEAPCSGASIWPRLEEALGRRLSIVESDPLEGGGIVALVGPTGAGKTTTIAKLAARHYLRFGRERLTLMSADDFRVGAQHQLEAFGAILGAPVCRADEARARDALTEATAEGSLVLIDTAGGSPNHGTEDPLATLERLAPQLRRYLVLPANLQLEPMRRSVQRFRADGLAGVALTKVDEVESLGVALSVLAGSRLPVAWIGNGPRIPEDLQAARRFQLVQWLRRALAEPVAPAHQAFESATSSRRPHGEPVHVDA